MYGKVGKHFTGIQIFNHGSLGNIDNQFGSTTTVQVLTHSVNAVACSTVRVIPKRQQRSNVMVGYQPDRSTIATIATVWPTECNRAFTTETDTAKTAVATANVELGFVDKCAHRGFLGY
jgi:hypothetical protein